MKKIRIYITRLFLIACAVLMIVSCDEKKQFDGYLYPIRENGLYGYIDSVGNRIIEPEFLWVSAFHNGLAMAVVDTVYREVPDSMAYEVGERDTIINVYRMYAKYGYIDKSGDFVIEPKFISYVNMNEIGDVTNDMDDCSNALYRNSFRNRRAMFYDTRTWKNGYIDTKGNIVIPPKYYYSEPFSEGLAVVRDAVAEPLYTNKACITPSKLRCAYLDTLGNLVTEFKYESLTKFSSGRGIGSYKRINRKPVDIADTTIIWETYSIPRYLLNRDGEEIKELSFNYDYYGFSRNGISVSADGFFYRSFVGKDNISYYFIDINGEFLEPLKGLSEYQLDSLGKCDDIIQVLPENAKIAAATNFNDGFAGISPDKIHWLIIDKFLLIHGYGDQSIFDGFRPFNNGLAAVKKNGKWGFINKKIKEQVPCKYDSCGVVYPYLEEVFEYDIQREVKKKAYINRKDSLVWESPIYKSEKIENRYSVKDRKDWGKWTYKYNSIKEYLTFLITGAIVVLFILFVVVWETTSNRHPKVVANKELVTRIEPELEVVSDASPTITTEVDPDEILSYPTVGQYTEAIMQAAKSPDDYFDKLKHLCPVLDSNGEPIMSSGNFAVVFKMRDEYGKQYAVRCFHRAQHGREENYKLICDELAKVSSPYLSSIKYYEKELFIDTDEYPVLLMDWVEGITLDKYIRKVLDNKKALRQLTDNFRKLSIWLLSQPFAHGDLKPDNILVKKDGSLVLVDYDGMYVPAMQGQKAREIGSPDFRSPSRTEDDFNKDIDNFPIITILLSLELLVENKEYLAQYGAEDKLLFSEEDYRDIENREIYKRAYSSYNDDVTELADQLRDMIHGNDKNVDICSLLIAKEKRNEAKKDNKRRLKTIPKILIIYNILVPLSAFIYSKTIPSHAWDILGVSAIFLCTAIALYFIIGAIDLTRPYKRYHLYIDDDYSSIGCVFSLFHLYIPLIGLLSPNYKEAWYITLLVIVIWFVYYMVLGSTMSGSFELFYSIFKTNEEIRIEEEEKKREVVRSELRKEKELEQMKLKIIEEQKRRTIYDDLPY
ncbi:MAG: WG repeat-containing protein [Prevotella sp.]|nr:WG repeat-containing protein [Prevotella sp.]